MKKKAQEFAHDKMLPKFTDKDFENLFPALSEERKIADEERTEENIAIIDEHFRHLSATVVFRELTDEEESAILDIVDEYTPKDHDGNYLYPLLPFDYAWEIYQIKNQ